jgi:lipopolysaccharide export system protein LptC
MGITLLVVLTLAAVAMVFIRQRAQSGDGTIDLPKMATKAVMQLAGVRQTATKDGAVQWELEAATAELEAKSGRMILKNPEVDFFLEDGGKVRITARKGVLNTKTNNIKVQGNVRIEDSRYILTTEAMSYDHEARTMHSATPVRIDGNTMSLEAATMWYYLDTQQALFSGNVKGRIDEELPL